MEKENNVKLSKENEKENRPHKDIQWVTKGKRGRKPKQTNQK